MKLGLRIVNLVSPVLLSSFVSSGCYRLPEPEDDTETGDTVADDDSGDSSSQGTTSSTSQGTTNSTSSTGSETSGTSTMSGTTSTTSDESGTEDESSTSGDTSGTSSSDDTSSTSTSSTSDDDTSGTSTSSSTSDDDTSSTTTTSSTSDDDTSTSTSDGTDTGGLDCPMTQHCLPPFPVEWTGPVTVLTDANAAPACSGPYGESVGLANGGLQAGTPQCSCGCIVSGVSCSIYSNGSGGYWMPQMSCDTPLVADDCLTAEVISGCTTNEVDSIPIPTWLTQHRLCGGGFLGDACENGGTCATKPGGSQRLCIYADGDLTCPSAYPDRQVFHGDYTDTRSCSDCTCQATGQACSIDIEVCSVGFYEHTLISGGDEHCLNSSDGDGVTFFQSTITNNGTCSTNGGTLQGSVSPTEPVTVCCLPPL